MNALCNLLCKKLWEVTASLLGRFLSRHCFTLLNLELRSSTKATTVAVAEITGDGGWKKSVFASFFGDQKIASSGHPIARATSYCLLLDTFWLRAFTNVFKLGSVKFTVTAFHCEESTHWKQKQPRDLSDAGQKSRELTTAVWSFTDLA